TFVVVPVLEETLKAVHSLTTWKLVTTCPFAETKNPVPDTSCGGLDCCCRSALGGVLGGVLGAALLTNRTITKSPRLPRYTSTRTSGVPFTIACTVVGSACPRSSSPSSIPLFLLSAK